ncbi:hypothetical protein GS498_20345 [Rhodococcus hoagii]|nr:hypothetical protein [Prescottella equi]
MTSFCAPNDTICSLSGKSKAVAAVVPLLNLTPEDLPEYALNKGLELVRNVASAKPADIQKAATSVITQMTRLSVPPRGAPATLPMELARGRVRLDDARRRGAGGEHAEFDALVSLTHPEELVQQATQVAAYLLLDAHRSYANYPVDETGDTAPQWVVKWVTAKVQARSDRPSTQVPLTFLLSLGVRGRKHSGLPSRFQISEAGELSMKNWTTAAAIRWRSYRINRTGVLRRLGHRRHRGALAAL